MPTGSNASLGAESRRVPPGSNGISGIFSNVMQASRWVHASPSFVGFDVANPLQAGRVQCFRAVEESAAYVARAHVEIIEQVAGMKVDEAVLTGGAAKGTLWPQIVADVLGMPIHVPVVKESTALGAAIYAGVGVGLFDDAAAAGAQLVRFDRRCEPDAGAVAVYRELYDQWLAIYSLSLELAEAGLVRPLWRAAGA